MNNVLVLCAGNICRSPVAEALLRHALPEKHVFSAGIEAVVGRSPDARAVRLMHELGIDISSHKGQQLTSWMLNQAELILVMEAAQKTRVESMYPIARGKVFRIGEFAGLDVFDPYGKGDAAMIEAFELIVQAAAQWVTLLGGLASKAASAKRKSA